MKNRGFKNVCAAVLLPALLAAGFSGCGGKASPAVQAEDGDALKMKEGGDLVFGVATELNNFDPFTSLTADVRAVNFNIFEGLVKVSDDGGFVPALASAYEVSPDAKKYTFTLRSGVKFHDGRDVTAEDVRWSLQHAIDKKLAGYDNIKEYSFDGDKLSVMLGEPDTGFIARMTAAVVPAGSTDLALHPVGTGPFKFVEYEEQDHIKLVKNESYWGTPAHLDSVTVKFESSQAGLVLSFQAGTIDGFNASADTISQLDESSMRKYLTNSNTVQLLALNNDFGPFQNADVRRALNYLVNSEEIIAMVNYGYGAKLGSGLIPNLAKYYDSSLSSVYDRDVDKAKELLQKAGYGDGFSFTITVPSNYTVHVRTAEVIVNELASAGIDAKIRQVDWATWLQNVYKGRQFEATVVSLDGSIAYPTAFLSRYVSSSGKNFINFKSAAYDAAYISAEESVDEAQQVEGFKKAQQILNSEAASVWIQDIAEFTVYNKKFAGTRHYPLYVSDYSAIYQVED
ncbi:MAG: hypothetical protein II187_10675 [Treponema sp.]|nr:hypothetical protein [Treponema sp.]